MTDVQDSGTGSEPSMEEILASIRRIIADEKEPESADAVAPVEEAKEDVLELTQLVQDDGSIANVKDEPPPPIFTPEPLPVSEPPVMVFEQPASPPSKPMAKEEADALLSDLAESTAANSLAALASTVHVEKKASFSGFTPLGSGKSLEDLVMEMMKPMLKEWLDQNLPPVVERLVQKEVERIARRVQD